MSTKEVYLTREEIDHPYANLAVMLEDKRKKAEQMSKTVFSCITASPEVLAATVVYPDWAEYMGGDCWTSPFVERYHTKEEAIAATVAKLMEVIND